MNYQPALRFDGSNDRLQIPAYISTLGATGDAVHVFVVSRVNANSTDAWQTTYGIINSNVNALWRFKRPGNYLAGDRLDNVKPNVFYGLASHIMPKAVGKPRRKIKSPPSLKLRRAMSTSLYNFRTFLSWI